MDVSDRITGAPVSLHVPADPGFFHMVRSLVALAASMLEIPMDQIDDQRLVVSETCTLLLACVPDAQSLRVDMWPTADRLTIAVSVDMIGPAQPAPEFSWVIIRQLAPDATESDADRRKVITMTWPTVTPQA